MIVLDASALVAALRREPAAADVRTILEGESTISAINMAEVIDVFVRGGRTWPAMAEAYDLLRSGGLKVTPADEEIAMFAGEIRARHYHRTNAPLSMADCFALATANTVHAELATSDAVVIGIGREIGFGIRALPDSGGHRS